MATAGDTLKVAGLVSITPSFAIVHSPLCRPGHEAGWKGAGARRTPPGAPWSLRIGAANPLDGAVGRSRHWRGTGVGPVPLRTKGHSTPPLMDPRGTAPLTGEDQSPAGQGHPSISKGSGSFGRDGSAQACLPYNPDSVRLAGAVVAAAGHSPRASQVRRPPPQARRRDAGPPPPSYRSRRHATPEGRGRRHDAGDVTQVGNHHPVGGQAVPRVAHCQHGRTSKGRQLPRVGPAGTPVRPSARVGPPMDDAHPGAAPRSPVTRLADPPSGRRRGKQRRRLWSAPPAALFLGTTHPRAASRRLRCATRHDTRRRRSCRRHQLGETQLPNGE